MPVRAHSWRKVLRGLSPLKLPRFQLNNLLCRLKQIGDHSIWRTALALTIWCIEQQCPAASRLPSNDITPAIANHKAQTEIDPMCLRRLEEQAGTRLAAITPIGVIVVTGEDGV